MNLSKRGEYGLRALIHIGIAQELNKNLVSIAEIAEKENIPLKFLEQIFAELKRGGYLESQRGANGGYRLKLPMEAMKIGDIIRRLDGHIAPIRCASTTAYAPCSCLDEAHCGLRMLMLDVRNAIVNIVDRYTLKDVVEVTLRKLRSDNMPLPYPDTSAPSCPSSSSCSSPASSPTTSKPKVKKQKKLKP